MTLDRRKFTQGLVAASAALTVGPRSVLARPAYTGPNVIIVRFGGGVRRRETIEPATTYAPYFLKELAPKGVLVPDISIANIEGVETSHEEGTLNILTGRYKSYRAFAEGVLEPHLEATEPTLLEIFRKTYDVAPHEALYINGEDRPQEEFFAYGAHPSFGVAFRSEVLSLYRFKRHKLQRILEEGKGNDEEQQAARNALSELEDSDWRNEGLTDDPAIRRFWDNWRERYGDSGLVNPRGDRLLTELAVTAMAELSPKLMMICYQDPDYVHWGNASHYTRAIAIIDEGLKRLMAAAETLAQYRGRTVLAIVPDCGRDANPLMDVPFQHHFNTRSAHEIFALLVGAGIPAGRVVDRGRDQTEIAPTLAALMGLKIPNAEGEPILEALA